MANINSKSLRVNCSSSKYPETYCIIDADDAPLALLYKWTITKGGSSGSRNHPPYVRGVDRTGNKAKYVRLHRLIMNAKPDEHIDHINGNTLDNRKSNLRVVTPQENQANSRKKSAASSKFKGVAWSKPCNKWRAYININRHQIHLGTFETELEAAMAYDKKAKELFGEYAYINLG